MAAYAPAPAVETIAKDLIDEHHTHLHGVRIRYVFIEQARRHNGDPVQAATKKVTGFYAWLTRPGDKTPADPVEPSPYFVIEVAKDVWDDHLTDRQRRALIDHHLARCGVDHTEDGEPRLFVRDPDVSEFRSVLVRQGAWNEGLHYFAKEAKQMTLTLDEASESGELRPDYDDEGE